MVLVRLYVDEELKRTDALQVQDGSDESFYNLFKRQESSAAECFPKRWLSALMVRAVK